MEPIQKLVSQDNALTKPTRKSSPYLPNEEYAELSLLVKQMADRYLGQDLAPMIKGIVRDLEQLAVRHSLQAVYDALAELRIRPGQEFFPRLDEVASEIERQQETKRLKNERVAASAKRQKEIDEFWKMAPEWMEITGNDEAELLRRFPSYRGTKALSFI